MKIIKFNNYYIENNIKEIKNVIFKKVLVILFIVVLLVVFYFFINSKKNLIFLFLLIFIFLLKLVYILIDDINILKEDIKFFLRGKKAEEIVLNSLKEKLDDNYVYIQNYKIPNTKIGDIDGLLIGPKGIILLEVKNYFGNFRISGGDMYRKIKRDIYKLYKKDPFKQILKQKEYLLKFLKEKGLNTRVIPIIVLVNGKIDDIKGETNVFITEYYKLVNHIFEMSLLLDWNDDFNKKVISTLGIKNYNF